MANHTLSRKTFNLWRQEWQRHMQRRREIEEAITRSRLHKCLLTWRRNIVDRRRKQRQAVYLLETCLTHVTLLSWSSYTAYKTAFRASLQQHVWMIQRTTLTRCFHTWTNQLHVRLDERHQRELWSLSCVRKMTSRWLHKCHVRSLDNILQQTEPVRELVLLKRCFGDWLAAKGRAEEENMEVVAYQHLLQRCALQRQFQTWRLATQRCLTIRPLVHRQHRRLVTWCFDAWHQHVNNRTQVYNRGKQFQKCQLSRAFTRWRRQFHCQQVSRLAQHSLMQRLALCLLAQWRAILFRKHQAHRYHSQHLLQRTFHLWHRRAHRQLTDKAAQRAEQELSQDLKQGHFSRWWSGVQAQLMEDSDTVASLQQRSNHNHLRSSFSAWRRSLHAHLISRAYQQSVMLRMQRSVLLEWHNTASQLLCSAVQHFAQQIGLQQAATAGEEQEVPCEFGNSLGFEDLQNFENISQSNSPCSSSAASLKCLFASDQLMSSDRMLWGEMDLDRAVLLNSGLCETIEERRQKNRCLQELSILFVSRLRHWPISLVFDQWQEYTVRQRHLQQLAQQVDDKHRALIVSMAFQRWCVHWQHNQKAMDMRNWKLRHGSLMALLNYTGHRKMKARLAQKARGHLVKEVLAKIFPWWLKKAQEQRHQRTILHLWTTATPEEAKLLPLEASLSQKIRLRSLGTCLQAWRIRFLFLTKLKMVYHQQLLHRVFTTWQIWASVRQQEKRKGDHFLQARRKNLAFKSWRERQHQKQETERRYQTAVESYLRQVLWGWREWACLSKQHRHSRQVLEQHINTGRVQSHFRTWLHLTQHAQTIRTKHHTHLMSRLLQSWRQATKEGKRLRQTILSFQAASLAHVVAHLFHRWQLHYKQRLQLHQQREEWAQRSALHCSTVWRRKAQDTRGRKLIVVFKYNLLSRMFIRWQASLIRVEKLKVQQEQLMADRNREVMRGMLVEWRQRLQSRLVARQFTHRLLVTLLHTWTVYTKASKERRIRGLALQHALEERNLRLYFVYWHQMSVRVRSLQNNVEVRLQLRVLQAWSYAVRRRCSQRRTGEKFDRLRQHCIMAQAFATIRCRFDYCQGLKEIADSMCSRRDKRIALLALDRWKDAVDNVLAQRFFHRLVCVRTARQWLRFVVRAKAERRLQQEHHARAVSHHNKKICCRVIEVLKQEVTVRQQLQKRKQRQAKNFALRWKHLTDMAVTAVIVEEERLYAKFWHCWRLAWVSQQASNRDMALYRRQILSQVFTAWCSICPSRSQPSTSHLHHRTKVKAESGRDSPTTTRSFLPVPVGSGARR